MTVLLGILISPAVLGATAASAGEAFPEPPGLALPEAADLAPPAPDASTTGCSLLNTVCSTAVAVASLVCTKPTLGFAQCTGAGTVGGHGVSPTKLPGDVSWSGRTSCGGDCSNSRSTSGYTTWPGLLGANGNGGQITIEHPTVVKAVLCVKYSVSASVTSTAASKVLGVKVESKTVSANDATPVVIQCP